MLEHAAVAPSEDAVKVPVAFLRDLTRSMLGQIRGRGSMGRRNEIAAQVAELLSRHELDGVAHLTVAKTVAEELNSDTEREPGQRFEYQFDPKSGALCWSAPVVAEVLGVDKRVLSPWRSLGKGPKHIKLGDSQQSPVIYPITAVLEWLAERDRATAERFEDSADTAA